MRIKRLIVTILCLAMVVTFTPLQKANADIGFMDVGTEDELIAAIENAAPNLDITIRLTKGIKLSKELVIENKGNDVGSIIIRSYEDKPLTADLDNMIKVKGSEVSLEGVYKNTGNIVTVEGLCKNLPDRVTRDDAISSYVSIDGTFRPMQVSYF